jgi:hypothetical protein
VQKKKIMSLAIWLYRLTLAESETFSRRRTNHNCKFFSRVVSLKERALLPRPKQLCQGLLGIRKVLFDIAQKIEEKSQCPVE